MNNLYAPAGFEEVLARIDRLEPATQRQWGKMDVAQMLAHCANAMEMSCGTREVKRSFVGRFIGPLFRGMATSDKPFSRNSPTGEELKIADAREFERERARLRESIRDFHQRGEARCTQLP